MKPTQKFIEIMVGIVIIETRSNFGSNDPETVKKKQKGHNAQTHLCRRHVSAVCHSDGSARW